MDETHMFAKVVRCGSKIELYCYSQSILVGKERTYDIVRNKKEDGEQQKRYDNLLRSRQSVRRLIWCNMGRYTKFITLTYSESVLDVKRVRRDITTFCQAMRRLGWDLKYLYVLEHQTERGKKEGNEGSWHIHMVVFIDDYIPKEDLVKCWKHGFVDINAIDSVKDLGAYVCKYITKDNSAEFGCHVYGVSRKLKRPEVERFFTEGLSDTTIGLHPKEIEESLNVSFQGQTRHDYLDDDGAGHSLIVNYLQGTWKKDDIIEKYRDMEVE